MQTSQAWNTLQQMRIPPSYAHAVVRPLREAMASGWGGEMAQQMRIELMDSSQLPIQQVNAIVDALMAIAKRVETPDGPR